MVIAIIRSPNPLLALGNVADEIDEQPPAELFAAGNRQFDRKLASVAVKRTFSHCFQ